MNGISCSDYFEKLRCKTREIDDTIDKLVETWNTPHLLIGGYEERTSKMDEYLEELRKSLRNTNDAIETFRSKLKPSLDETDNFLEETQAMYKDLQAKCDDIDIVLAEYGYYYEEDADGIQENCSENNSITVNTNKDNYSILTPRGMSDVEVEFTPNLTWKSKTKYKESNQKDPIVRSIATPVIKSLASIQNFKIDKF